MPSAWQSYLNQQKLPLTVYSAKSTSVHFLDEKQERVFVSNIYDCIGFETSVDEDGSTGDYVLSSGRWYRASSSFIASVNQELMRLAVPDRHPLKPWNSTDDEGVYNSSCTLGSASLYLFDAKKYSPWRWAIAVRVLRHSGRSKQDTLLCQARGEIAPL